MWKIKREQQQIYAKSNIRFLLIELGRAIKVYGRDNIGVEIPPK